MERIPKRLAKVIGGVVVGAAVGVSGTEFTRLQLRDGGFEVPAAVEVIADVGFGATFGVIGKRMVEKNLEEKEGEE